MSKQGCNYCHGDEALWWKDEKNSAFIDSHGEIMVIVNGSEARFNVSRCPQCGFDFNKQLNEE